MERSLTPRYFGLPWIGLALCCLLLTPVQAEILSIELQREGRQAERLSTIRQLDGQPGSILRIASEAGTDFEFTLDRVARNDQASGFSQGCRGRRPAALVTSPDGSVQARFDVCSEYRYTKKETKSSGTLSSRRWVSARSLPPSLLRESVAKKASRLN